jgi:hypothetical protein
MLELAPAFADRVRGATCQARFVGAAVANFFRQPYGPGWALVGDAARDAQVLPMYELTTQLATAR